MHLLKLILLSTAIFQGIVIGFILLKSPFFKKKANKYLAFAIFSLIWSLLKMALDIIETNEYSFFWKILEAIDSEMLLPVFILYFTIHQVNHPIKNFKKLPFLFVPALISTVIVIIINFGLDINEQNIEIANTASIAAIILTLILLLISLFFIPFVLFKTFKIIKFSKQEKERKWLSLLWLFEILILGAFLLIIIIGPFIFNELSNVLQILALLATFIIYWIAYTGIYKLKLINEQHKIRTLLNSKLDVKQNIKSSKEETSKKELKKHTKENEYYKELERLCSEQKIYRDSTLDRHTVATSLGISASYLSQLINSIEGVNFATYINGYRVKEIKQLILDKDFNKYSLLSIGLECGFSSKTTFYNAFKKITGVTPNTYKKTHK